MLLIKKPLLLLAPRRPPPPRRGASNNKGFLIKSIGCLIDASVLLPRLFFASLGPQISSGFLAILYKEFSIQ